MDSENSLPIRLTNPPRLPTLHAPVEVGRYRFIFNDINPNTLPAYSGSTWRGALGHALKRSSCVIKGTECAHCLLKRNCTYSYIFESSPPQDSERMRRYSTVPAPYILEPSEEFRPDSQNKTLAYALGLTLLGKSNCHLPNIIHAMSLVASTGLGRQKQTCQLSKVMQETKLGNNHWQVIYSPEKMPLMPLAITSHMPTPIVNQKITIKLLTPLRLRKNNKYLNPETFTFSDLFNNLLRRTSSVSYFHQQKELHEEFVEITQAARHVVPEAQNLTWVDWARFSSRQSKKIAMGGLVGTLTFNANDIAPFWNYLWLGQWIHAGKGTTMGLGKYRITSDPTRT